ncbi:Hypothetical predicted protein [Octopus vulgaris]|uniref:Uncharacterized protein n=1 Tax=Octopus vulgaris TaxID=6645 RepID=A0AA36FGU4_OCTVU|nr:Hypothetical predicted protein [Octopus vulgaris]
MKIQYFHFLSPNHLFLRSRSHSAQCPSTKFHPQEYQMALALKNFVLEMYPQYLPPFKDCRKMLYFL